jgi:hypothetical protein
MTNVKEMIVTIRRKLAAFSFSDFRVTRRGV